MRLIDADAFVEFLRGVVKHQKYEDLTIDGLLTVADVIEAVISDLDGTSFDGFKNAPTIDAVPVVRCEDCKFRKGGLPYNADGLFLAVTPPVCGLMTGFIKDDGWCFKGERKDDVEEPD